MKCGIFSNKEIAHVKGQPEKGTLDDELAEACDSILQPNTRPTKEFKKSTLFEAQLPATARELIQKEKKGRYK